MTKRVEPDFPTSEDWSRFYAGEGTRMPTLVRSEGTTGGIERFGRVVLRRIQGAIDEGNIDALIDNLKNLGVELPSAESIPPGKE